MEQETNLRESETNLVVCGIVSEKKLTDEVKDDVRVIKGNLTIKTGEDNFVDVNVYCAALKKDKTENKCFKGIETVMNEYKTIASDGDQADYVSITGGKFAPNTYISGNNEVKTANRFSANFFKRITDKDNFEPKAEVTVELFITRIGKEYSKEAGHEGEETGRVIVEGYTNTYSGLEPVELIAPSEYGVASAIENSYKFGDTVTFYCDIVAIKHVEVKEIAVKIGKPRKETKVTYINELVISGATEPSQDGYTEDAINAALSERELHIEELKKKKKSGKGATNGGASVGASKPASSGRKLPF